MLCKWLKKASVKKTEPTLCIIIGHEKEKPGAYGVHPVDDYEYNYNSGLAVLIKQSGKNSNIKVPLIFRDYIGIKGAYNNALTYNPDAIIELHFNSYNSKVEGCEVLYTDKKDLSGIKEKAFASLLLNNIHDVMQNNNRGLKKLASKGERGFYNLSRTNKIPSVIIEPFFGDNQEDASKAINYKNELANSIIKSFIEYMKIQG